MEMPDLASALAVAGIGADSIMTGSSPARAKVCSRAIGFRPGPRAFSLSLMGRGRGQPGDRLEAELAGLLASHDEQGAGAVGDLRGVAGVDDPVFFEGGLERGELLHGGVAAHTLVGLEAGVGDGGVLTGECARVDRCRGLLV